MALPALDSLLKETLDRHFGQHCPANLREAVSYSLLGPGKRIRPRLSLATAELLKLPQEAVIPAALALEMVHCFTLIHDDLPCMDNDDFRRGRPSNHKKFGEALALLAGDALIPLALDTFLEAAPHYPPGRLMTALRRFSWAIGPSGVIGGQAAETLLDSSSRLEQVSQMFAQKTGALFAAAILIPMDLAGIAEDSSEGAAIDLFARELGFAFQVADDLEDELESEPGPTHILHYLSREGAITMTSQKLKSAMRSLEDLWGKQAEPLLSIAREIAMKLENA
jgi:geranylgeranyl diphosphate synthase type II